MRLENKQQLWTEAVAKVRKTFGALNILVNNAGSNAAALIPAVDLKVWNEVFAINVTGVLRTILGAISAVTAVRARCGPGGGPWCPATRCS